jgi:hypothetical protein
VRCTKSQKCIIIPRIMMEYLELRLRRSSEPADNERAEILRVMRLSRGKDIEWSSNITEWAQRVAILEDEVTSLRKELKKA